MQIIIIITIGSQLRAGNFPMNHELTTGANDNSISLCQFVVVCCAAGWLAGCNATPCESTLRWLAGVISHKLQGSLCIIIIVAVVAVVVVVVVAVISTVD